MADSDSDDILEILEKAVGILLDNCDQCQLEIEPGELSKYPIMGMKKLHKKCFAALKSLYRIISKKGNEHLKKQIEEFRE